MSDASLMLPDDADDLLAKLLAGFRDKTADEVLKSIQSALRMTVESWVTVAAGVRALEEKGVDVNRIRAAVGPFLNLLRRIAAGQLLASVVCRFYNQIGIINRIGRLPAPDQKRLASGERVAVLVPGGSGYTSRMLTPDEMTPDQFRQVFAADHIRTETEQAAWLDGKRAELSRPVPEAIGPFRIDKDAGAAIFTGKKGTLIDEQTILAVARALRR